MTLASNHNAPSDSFTIHAQYDCVFEYDDARHICRASDEFGDFEEWQCGSLKDALYCANRFLASINGTEVDDAQIELNE